AQSQREREEWYRQQEQARAQKEWDDWQRQREETQRYWDERERAQKAADDWQAHLDYHRNLMERIDQICRERDEILGRGEDWLWGKAAGEAVGGPWVPQPMENPFVGSPAKLPTRQAFPQLIENPFVGPPATKPGSQVLDPHFIQNPFVGPPK